MREMQNIEYAFMAKELSQLEGKHFSKIQSMGEKSFRMKIGDAQLVVELPYRVGIAKYISKSEEPTGFTERLKKLLDNQKLNRVFQCGTDRIICLEFDKHVLFLEMFSKGNIVLCGKDGKIIEILREEKWKDRTLEKGEIYKEPVSQSVSSVGDSLSEKYAIVCLIRLPLGKEYAKEMLDRCKIEEKKPGNALSKEEIACLEKEYSEIPKKLSPFLFLENGKPVDYGLVQFTRHKASGREARGMPSLSEAMEEYYASASKESAPNPALEKLERRLAEQKSTLERLKTEERDAKEKGDFIYANYQKIESLLELAKKSGMNSLGSAFKDYKIWKIDKEKKEIELEL